MKDQATENIVELKKKKKKAFHTGKFL